MKMKSKLSKTRYAALLAFVLMSVPTFSQTHNTGRNEGNRDLLCQDSLKNCPDTIGLDSHSVIRRIPMTGTYKKGVTKNPNNIKSPKIDPYKKKFSDLQIFNAIRPHISK